MQQSLIQYLLRVGVFLALIFIIIVLLYPVLQNAFLSNIFINLIILGGLAIGITFNLIKLIGLNIDYTALANFEINKSPKSFFNNNGNLKNISSDLKQVDGRFVFKSSTISRLIENTDMSLSSVRETSRYLVGLLVFLGLLGTFWGLLKTIGSVGNVISGLGIDDTNVAGFFNSLKDGLNAPLQGMSIAFSSSLLGLAGSLILGFMDINLGQAQNKFSLFFEKTLENNSIPYLLNTSPSDNLNQQALQKIYDNLDSIVYSLKKTSENQNEINSNLSQLNDQIKNANNHSAGLDEKLSNFLSTQLNTQSSILQLINKINEQGILDNSTKKIFEDLNNTIQELNANNKK
jgi:biopolymer transport protein ExbB/TolQ